MLEASPVGDSKSNGVAERAIQSTEMLIRVHKLSIETRINEMLSVRHLLFAWLVEFCADLHNRFQIGSDGKTAHQRLKGTHSSQVMVEFGTAVMFRVCGKVQGSSMGERWFHGIFLGKKAGTEENTISPKIITVSTRYRLVVLELIKNCNACNFTRRHFFWNYCKTVITMNSSPKIFL